MLVLLLLEVLVGIESNEIVEKDDGVEIDVEIGVGVVGGRRDGIGEGSFGFGVVGL